MKSKLHRCAYAFTLLFGAQLTFAQSGSSNNNLVLWIVGGCLALLLGAILFLTDSLMQVEASKSGVDTSNGNFSIFSGLFGSKSSKKPKFVKEGHFYNLKKGYDIKLVGEADTELIESVTPNRVAIQPQDFLGISPIPKVVLSVGDEVLAGQELFFDKKRPEIKYVSPVSGEVVDIVRGAKRAITQVVILADKETRYLQQNSPNIESTSREEIVTFMAKSGAWTLLNQRPFDIVPDLDAKPTNIFVSTFNTAPLAPDASLLIKGKEIAFQKGLDVLNKLTEGKVYLGLDGRGNEPVTAFVNATGVEKNWFSGKHPAGNVGVQIHHTAPINAGDTVWTLDVEQVAQLGELFVSGKYDASRVVAITGSEVATPKYVSTVQGANIADILKNNVKSDNVRIICGDVLSGKQSSIEGFLHFDTDQITVLPEGDDYELFGWLLPLKPRPSVSNTFPGFLMPNYKYEPTTNTHGEKRAIVTSGVYESVTPMDIYPQHLVKAVVTNDFERMEGLGILELSEEDVALCEFVCPSKTPVQQIIRQGLDMVQDQL